MLRLGKDLNRCYSMRLPFLDGFYKIDIFFNNSNTFLLFGAEQEILNKHEITTLKTFKNLKSSTFAELFLDLHDFHSENLDIIDQYKQIKNDYINDIQNNINENIILMKYVDVEGKIFYDSIIIYGFTFVTYPKDFIFLIAERQNISKKLQKKFVRSTAIQISTKKTLELIKEYKTNISNQENELFLKPLVTDSNKIITLE